MAVQLGVLYSTICCPGVFDASQEVEWAKHYYKSRLTLGRSARSDGIQEKQSNKKLTIARTHLMC